MMALRPLICAALLLPLDLIHSCPTSACHALLHRAALRPPARRAHVLYHYLAVITTLGCKMHIPAHRSVHASEYFTFALQFRTVGSSSHLYYSTNTTLSRVKGLSPMQYAKGLCISNMHHPTHCNTMQSSLTGAAYKICKIEKRGEELQNKRERRGNTNQRFSHHATILTL
jgi:hypothetical protein